MSEINIPAVIEAAHSNGNRRFLLMIVMAISIAFGLVLISLELYNSSGTAQLDLSRPGYQSVRAQSFNDDSNFKIFSSNGDINQTTIDEFKSIYVEQSQKIKAVDAFGGDPLSPESMGFVDTSTK